MTSSRHSTGDGSFTARLGCYRGINWEIKTIDEGKRKAFFRRLFFRLNYLQQDPEQVFST